MATQTLHRALATGDINFIKDYTKKNGTDWAHKPLTRYDGECTCPELVTPLMEALYNQQIAVAEYLIEELEVNINYQGPNDGKSVLYEMVYHNKIKALKFLLTYAQKQLVEEIKQDFTREAELSAIAQIEMEYDLMMTSKLSEKEIGIITKIERRKDLSELDKKEAIIKSLQDYSHQINELEKEEFEKQLNKNLELRGVKDATSIITLLEEGK